MIDRSTLLVIEQAGLSMGTRYHGFSAPSLLHRLWLYTQYVFIYDNELAL